LSNPVLKKNIESHYEDLSLIEKIINKDVVALETIYNKYSKRLTNFINGFVSPYDDVQDILQITFISSLDSLNRYDGNCKFFTWLCAIARHKIGDYYRANQKPVDSLDNLGEGYQWLLIAGDENNPKELRSVVCAVLELMPEHYRDLLIEKYILGKTLKEIAASRTMTVKAAESLLTRARQYFKKLVKENNYFSGGYFHEE